MIIVNGYMPTYTSFPNGELNVSMDDSAIEEAIESQKLEVTWRFKDNNDFIKLGILISYLESFKKLDTVFIYFNILYLPYERMDRHEIGSHNSFSLSVVNNMLHALGGTIIYKIIEPHSSEIFYINDSYDGGKYFDDDGKCFSQSVYPSVQKTKELLSGFSSGNRRNLLVFPDKGALARYKKFNFYNCDIVVGHKTRDFNTHKITDIYVTNLQDERVDDISKYDQAIIIDDLVSYGGTFTRLGKLLKDNGIPEVTLVVCHAEDSIFKGSLLTKSSPIDCVWATETMTNITSKALYNKKLNVYSFLI